MPRLDQIVVPGIAILAGIVIASVLYRVGATDVVGGILVTGFVAILASYCDLVLDRVAERARVQSAFHHVNLAQDQIRSNADLTRRALVELKLHVDDRMSSRNDSVISEVKVLESLVRRLAENIADKAKDHEPDAEEEFSLHAPAIISRHVEPDSDDAMVDVIRRSLEDNRVDLYLQPVVSLPQRKVRFYEALSRLRADDGTIIMPSQYIRVAEPAGLMSVVDNVLLFRCIQVLRSWTQRSKDIGVFCNLSHGSLQDAGFFSQFIEFMQQHRELASLLIFEISQDTFANCGPVEQANLNNLADLGFGFSMDKVTTLDVDFAAARARQIRYFKVPAKLLLGDPEKAGARVHPADLKELLSRFGMNLIGERIEHERDVVDLLDYNVDFGQGFLFGEAKPIRDSIFGQSQPKGAMAPSTHPFRPRAVASAR
ncbi:MAG: EAL domain-containing protein [Alphaproteobacteria bacterium]|nr:EAL domain-containing protein [Alphaproteobacteria bacterium]